MFFRVLIFFIKRLLFPVVFGIVSCILLAVLFTVFSEQLYSFVPVITMVIFCVGLFISSKICTSRVKHLRSLLGLLCSFIFYIVSSSISAVIFHNFLFSNFLIKLGLAIVFGLLGSLKLKNDRKYNRNK